MAGEELSSIEVTSHGLTGDRAYALVDTTTGKVGSAKNVRRFAHLLNLKATYGQPPTITNPDGTAFDPATLGPGVELLNQPPANLMLEFPAGTLDGKHANLTEAPMATFFDLGTVMLVTQASLDAAAAPIDRCRPNILINAPDLPAFAESAWAGHTLQIGDNLKLQVSIPCPRCVMTTLPQGNLPADPGFLKRLSDLNKIDLGDYGHLPCLGIYAEVLTPGNIQVGDPVQILSTR